MQIKRLRQTALVNTQSRARLKRRTIVSDLLHKPIVQVHVPIKLLICTSYRPNKTISHAYILWGTYELHFGPLRGRTTKVTSVCLSACYNITDKCVDRLSLNCRHRSGMEQGTFKNILGLTALRLATLSTVFTLGTLEDCALGVPVVHFEIHIVNYLLT